VSPLILEVDSSLVGRGELLRQLFLVSSSTGLVDYCDGSEQGAAVHDGKKPRQSPSKKYSGLVSASA